MDSNDVTVALNELSNAFSELLTAIQTATQDVFADIDWTRVFDSLGEITVEILLCIGGIITDG